MKKSPSRPVSEKRLAANRANAQKSTGPRTPEGKAAASRNAVKHGFCSSSFAVVRLEDLDEVSKLKADAVSCYRPRNAQELIAVERIALAQQQIFRAARLEAGLFTDALNEAFDPRDGHPMTPMSLEVAGDGDIGIAFSQNRNYALAEGFRKMARESNVWSAFLRYQAQAERNYRRAIEEFDRLKALRDEFPNEPNIGAEPEQKEELLAPDEVNPRAGQRSSAPPATVTRPQVPPSPAAKPSAPSQDAPGNPPHTPQNPLLPAQIKPAA